jgi:4-hydroxy-3-methylbut-2-enyl diphosphate reductase
MKINLAKSAGFCFGVRRALKIALEAGCSGAAIEMLGDIVHNEAVVRMIRAAGIKKIGHLSKGKGKAILIRAHGASAGTIQEAYNLGYKVIDATCPMVKEIHRIAKDSEQKGYKVIIIGDKKHDEVKGIVGQLKSRPIIIESVKSIPLERIKRINKAAAVVQSTQNLEKAFSISRFLGGHIKEFKFFNTVCKPTRVKQGEMKTMPVKNDVMIVIGSRSSANTKRLYQISKSLNKKTYWIQSRRQIEPRWFKGISSVGITAGASTPDSTTRDVIEYIRQIT